MTTTFGAEEEYFLVDAGSGNLASRAGEVLGRAHDLAGDQVTSELNQCQLEPNTNTGSVTCAYGSRTRSVSPETACAGASTGTARNSIANVWRCISTTVMLSMSRQPCDGG